jgi:hypothetical protein
MSEHTVAKIIRSEDFQNFIREQRERLFGIAPIAMDSLVAGVTTDPHLAYALLKDLGIIPARDLALALGTAKPPVTSAEERQERQARVLAAVILERKRVFDIELPEEMEKALDEVDESNPGQSDAAFVGSN